MSTYEAPQLNQLGKLARKRFGQNFLHDQNILRKIHAAINAKPTDKLVEIGPGTGALTEGLLAANPNLTAIELDKDLIAGLKAKFFNYPNFTLHQGDALKFDFTHLLDEASDTQLRLIGNLPYNISTPLLLHLFSYHAHIKDMHFMLQEEVVDRLAAAPNSGQWGRLSVISQYYCRIEKLFQVPPNCFVPRPKVNSAIVRLTFKPSEQLTALDTDILSETVRLSFSQRRKTLRNNLKGVITSTSIEKLGLNPQARPETLSLDDFIKLANFRVGN